MGGIWAQYVVTLRTYQDAADETLTVLIVLLNDRVHINRTERVIKKIDIRILIQRSS